ncbi:hypothetical protein [Beijerinckia indica]|uniref:hypothetical protein n=1 Tax=Beijerinckia indica TaxID=533 RepID=UPI0002DB97CB|nr:hypothetical protein [Beijerinckia indica]
MLVLLFIDLLSQPIDHAGHRFLDPPVFFLMQSAFASLCLFLKTHQIDPKSGSHFWDQFDALVSTLIEA